MQRAVHVTSTAWALPAPHPVSSLTAINQGRQRKYLGILKRAMRKSSIPSVVLNHSGARQTSGELPCFSAGILSSSLRSKLTCLLLMHPPYLSLYRPLQNSVFGAEKEKGSAKNHHRNECRADEAEASQCEKVLMGPGLISLLLKGSALQRPCFTIAF